MGGSALTQTPPPPALGPPELTGCISAAHQHGHGRRQALLLPALHVCRGHREHPPRLQRLQGHHPADAPQAVRAPVSPPTPPRVPGPPGTEQRVPVHCAGSRDLRAPGHLCPHHPAPVCVGVRGPRLVENLADGETHWPKRDGVSPF